MENCGTKRTSVSRAIATTFTALEIARKSQVAVSVEWSSKNLIVTPAPRDILAIQIADLASAFSMELKDITASQLTENVLAKPTLLAIFAENARPGITTFRSANVRKTFKIRLG